MGCEGGGGRVQHAAEEIGRCGTFTHVVHSMPILLLALVDGPVALGLGKP